MTDHRNVVRQNYFRDIGDVMLVRNLFRLIRVIKRTNSRPIWTPTCEDIDHNAKITSFTLPKKNPQCSELDCYWKINNRIHRAESMRWTKDDFDYKPWRDEEHCKSNYASEPWWIHSYVADDTPRKVWKIYKRRKRGD